MKKISDNTAVNKFVSIRNSADSRGIEFNMTINRIKQLLSAKRCFISGVELHDRIADDNKLTFDRLDNTKGYIDSNVVACSLKMNRLKASLTIEEIKMLYKAISKIK